MHVPFVHWVVVEDAKVKTQTVVELLSRCGIRYVHLLGKLPEEMRAQPHWGRVPRGVSNRNTGLRWVRQHATDGVVYFADDDNTYDIRLFPELQRTRRVSVFPVGLVSRQGVSSPVVKDGRVVAFFDGWIGGRKFPMDMAGFAVSVDWLRQNPEAEMPYKAGYEEDGFLKALNIGRDELEPLANNCSQILVWHTQTQKVEPFERANLADFVDTNIVYLTKHLMQKTR
ncbi:galactosylgalactosylxylosylprotein 3-beta-glucuronosyltransferase P-like [Pollicipes pollicipes]|uniref:galactosylgalactosylxylosylprotein 3-beta-glucuronosyltransferase P-like n=1 Tax=Pollicipes pollicipes TaxID=41117 RepID=UPI001884E8B6|nr:galactosylgalactosylxylosylprotein 3-beta-glucuronosyltransferase P-like [Pollicipes pollicipes]